MKGDIFYAKIMLFGEYSVIFDSMGLTVPYSHFTGELSFINFEQYTDYESAVESNRHLGAYLNFLKELQIDEPDRFNLDLEKLARDIQNGLYFGSNIPQGYGIGSSGALVAAIFERYANSGVKSRNILTGPEIASLKSLFSKMESYFHGISSGIDPLLCYIRHPLLIRNRESIETVGIPRNKFGKDHAIFLIDTGVVGQTGPLVSQFLEWCRNPEYLRKIKTVLIPSNNACIEFLLSGEMDGFFGQLSILSDFQYHYLEAMIPPRMKPIWQAGLQREDFKLKLCGSGGGGFLLGISKDFKSTRKYFQQLGLPLIPVYQNHRT